MCFWSGITEHLGLCNPTPAAHQGFLPPVQRLRMDDTCICEVRCRNTAPKIGEDDVRKAVYPASAPQCGSYHMAHCPNLQPGKSEILVSLQGNASRKKKIQYFGPHSDGMLHIIGEQGLKKVRIVSCYSHLGCMIHHRPDNRKEARRRVGIAQQAFSQHRRHLLHNPVLLQCRRLEIFHTLVMSRFCYGTESWTLKDQATKTYVHNALMRLFRRLGKHPPDAHLTDDDILTHVEINSPTELLRLSRLRYLGTLYRCRHLVPWGLLNEDEEWRSLLHDDLSWMWHQLSRSSTLPKPEECFGAWEDILLHHTSYWRRLVRRAGAHAVLQRRKEHRVHRFHLEMCEIFQQVQPEDFTTRCSKPHHEMPQAPNPCLHDMSEGFSKPRGPRCAHVQGSQSGCSRKAPF